MRVVSSRVILPLLITAILSAGVIFAQKDEHKLTILFTGDIFGNVKSCGCSGSEDIGGIPRRATYIKQIRQETSDLLLLDTGDVVFGTDRYAEIRINYYAKAIPIMAYDAVGIGDTEAAYMRLSDKSEPYGRVPMLSANIVDAATGKPIGSEPYIIKQTASGLKVGIISIFGDNLMKPELISKLGLRILPSSEVLAKYIPEIRSKADLVILLSHTGPDLGRRLAAEVPGIDVVICGHSAYAEKLYPEKIGNALFMQTMLDGRHVGKIVLDIDSDRKIASSTGEYVAMGSSFADDPDMTKLMDKFDKDMLDYFMDMRAQSAQDDKPFVSASTCRKCHETEYSSWAATDHAKALETLKKTSQAADAECVNCHTTGFKVKGGYTSEAETPQFANVQCEVCHAPGAEHSRKPAKGYGKVNESTCRECHIRAKSPEFDFEVYKKRIAHPKD